jgi:histidinol dehydrogenase
MQIVQYPARETWEELLKRPVIDSSSLFETVRQVLEEVRKNGDQAVKSYTQKFDGVKLDSLVVTAEEIETATKLVSDDLKRAIETAKNNIRKFHTQQLQKFEKIETSPGVCCWQKAIPIEKVGLYIPGGTAPLFSTVLMLAIPAQIATCKEIILCTPPDVKGKIHPAILYAAQTAGVSRIFKIGGTQAIAAMAYGTETVPKIYKIFGPGNQYVTAAKQLVSLKDVAIDMPAGPSEVEVLADETAVPAFVAADLLSQAEHGVDSQSILITTDKQLIDTVQDEVALQLENLPRKKIAREALKNSKIILVRNLEEAIELTNIYAPEHLIIATKNYRIVAESIVNAGSVFLGNYTPESAGDYASGTNHTLPTNGYAKAYSGVNLDSFMRKVTFQEITQKGLNALGNTIMLMAEEEALQGHSNAVRIRLSNEKRRTITN